MPKAKFEKMPEDFDANNYDHVIVAFSGGKDSLACVLHLLDLGVPKEKIELWHHDIDGQEGSTLMDWPVTRSYCRAVAKALDLPLYFSWREGGFEREMLRTDAPTAAVIFETPDGTQRTGGISKSLGTRNKFPMKCNDLSRRWCSAYLKIMVCSSALNNQERFLGKKVLLITGERAEESPNRAKYAPLEVHNSTTKSRTVHQWRPVQWWTEKQVWEIIERYGVNPHPAYKLGWNRLSCMSCIYIDGPCWATLRTIAPKHFERIARYEQQFACTIDSKLSVIQQADKGEDNQLDCAEQDVEQALATEYTAKVIVKNWKLPAGAFKKKGGCGPT